MTRSAIRPADVALISVDHTRVRPAYPGDAEVPIVYTMRSGLIVPASVPECLLAGWWRWLTANGFPGARFTPVTGGALER